MGKEGLYSIKSLRKNFYWHLLVFAAFGIIVLAAALFTVHLVRGVVIERADDAMRGAEAEIRIGMLAAELTLFTSWQNASGMMEAGYSMQDLRSYLAEAASLLHERGGGLFNVTGLFAYINGEFAHSRLPFPDQGGRPQDQMWYQSALAGGGQIVYTYPRIDSATGAVTVSAVRAADSGGGAQGFIGADIDISALEHVPITGGRSIILGPFLQILSHRNLEYIGMQLHELGGAYAYIAYALQGSDYISAMRIREADGSLAAAFFHRVRGGWVLGVTIPYFQFYQELFLAIFLVFVLAAVFFIALSRIMAGLCRGKAQAQDDDRLRAAFLAKMIHEMRAPMNAVTGITDVVLKTAASNEERSFARAIKRACGSLLEITNNIVDFSKIQTGKLEIARQKYVFSFLIEDAVKSVNRRLEEKRVQFFTNIDSSLPDTLIGDEARLRQIIVNLLLCALKFTEKGHISLVITIKKQGKGQILLNITVTDTGRGIKKEEVGGVFDSFFQPPGSGEAGDFALYTTKRLCLAMGGDISVKSKYGYGSRFTAVIPQQAAGGKAFAKIENPKEKKALVWENRFVYAKSLNWTLNNLGVPHELVSSENDFIKALRRNEWDFIFACFDAYRQAKMIADVEASLWKKQPRFAVMTEWGKDAQIPGSLVLDLSTQALSAADILNEAARAPQSQHQGGGGRVIFENARILVVDDIETNLKVASGFIAPYKAQVDTASSGRAAVELAVRNRYDIIFMDHMMPEMDGVETAESIRKWEAEQPEACGQGPLVIVALTANAVDGMREMFLEKGFNDFLSKPINVVMLEEILIRWIPKEKMAIETQEETAGEEGGEQEGSGELPDIPGLDVERGLKMIGGNAAFYKKLLVLFAQDGKDRLRVLKTPPDPKNQTLHTLAATVHALKSACGYLGAVDMASRSAEMEIAAKSENLEVVLEKLPNLAEEFENLISGIEAWASGESPGGARQETQENLQESASQNKEILALFEELEGAVESQAHVQIHQVLGEILKLTQDALTINALQAISNHIQLLDFEEALEVTVKEISRRASR